MPDSRPSRLLPTVAAVCLTLALGLAVLAVACGDSGKSDPVTPQENGGKTSKGNAAPPEEWAPGLTGVPRKVFHEAMADRAIKASNALSKLPTSMDGKEKLAPPDSVTVIVRDLQGYSDDCGCSGEAIGGITRVAAAVPEVMFDLPGTPNTGRRSFVFIGRLLLPTDVPTIDQLRQVVMSQVRARVLVTAKFLAALPNAVWVADEGELQELEKDGISWAELEPFRHPPEQPLVIEGATVRFPVQVLLPASRPGDAVPADSGNTTPADPSKPGQAPANPPVIDLIGVSDGDPKLPAVARLILPRQGDRARNIVVVARWFNGAEAAGPPVIDTVHGQQYQACRTDPNSVMANSALGRQKINRKRGIHSIAWWPEMIRQGYPEDKWLRAVVDHAEMTVGHAGVPLGAELANSIVQDLKAQWASCATCHPKAYEAWAAHKHTVAFLTLHTARKHADSRCINCHVQEVAVVSGKLATLPEHRGITCMTCHSKDKEPAVRCQDCHNPTTDPKGHWKAAIDHICPGDTVAPGDASNPGDCNRMSKVGTSASLVPAGKR